MGNTLATTQSNDVVSKEYDVDKKTFQLVFNKAIRLHQKYRSQFLDSNFGFSCFFLRVWFGY